MFRKPAYGTVGRPSGPLTAGLQGFYALNEGNGSYAFDSINGVTLAASGYGSNNPWMTIEMPGLGSSGTGQLFGATLPPALQYSFPITLAIGYRWTNTAPAGNTMVAGATYTIGSSAQSECWTIYRASGSNFILLAWNNGSAEQAANIGTGTIPGVDTVVAVTYTSSSQLAYLNGALVYTGSTAGNVSYSSNPQLNIGAFASPQVGANALVYWLAWWNRALSADEHALLGEAPRAIFDLFYPPVAPSLDIFKPPGAYVLSTAPGSYVLTGQPSNLTVGRDLKAVAGAYALTGQAAGLRYGRASLIGSPGSYALTGQASNLRVGHDLKAVAGAYVLTGEAAGLSVSGAQSLLTVPGSYVLTGQPSNLTVSRKVVGATGPFLLTGQAAGLRYGHLPLTAAVGTYALAGIAAGFRRGYDLSAATLPFVLTGKTAGMVVSGANTLIGSPASFLLTGQAALLTPVRKLTAVHGVYAISGLSAGLRASHTILTTPGPFILTGIDADLVYSVAATPYGVYLLTGSDALLEFSGATYEGLDVMAAIQTWWQANESVQLFSADRRLWHQVAPPASVLPYTTFFIVHEYVQTWTTNYPFWRDSIQINCHAAIDVDARVAALTIRDALKGTRLIIDGSEVCHCLPTQTGMYIGKKLGPNGSDCWIAFATFDICWTP